MPGFEKAELNGYVDYLYIRDYDRYETKYVLDYPDLKSSRMFWDNVTLGSYAIDLQGTRALPLGMGFGKPDRYGIPLRSFLLKSYDNVIVVGKSVGTTIKAYGSARIMATTAMAAQSIGIILGRETKQNKHLSELTQADFKRIHKYLAKDYKLVVDK
ncbi:FAD-dependent oxidoreductase [Paenibacillus sp. D2_2]|uniref:FAD-dependent oxidoreductase n=1 Tax=Paenibacillus sp. D2_2 TaxID=3073092 RepID=UPI00281517EB|nr:FAD-dependent oxidoreductase [Paenibacillus sp. D2_2]WMT40799.1 FAD-dependent oxidoreductase [Paenibacillus sp. D2_2]